MHVKKIITYFLSNVIHKTRVNSLIPVIRAVIHAKQLSLTRLGRSLDTSGKERSGIRRIDRLLANKYYQTKSIDVYKAIMAQVVMNQRRPVFLVDWSSLPNSHRVTEGGEHSVLRATLIAKGRSISVYEEVHPRKKEGNAQTHKAFLAHLESILPLNTIPYIVTDAGFRNPWFKAVSELGWDYVGRIRQPVHYHDGNQWHAVNSLYHRKFCASGAFLGEICLSKKSPMKTHLYAWRCTLKGRKKLRKSGEIENSKHSRAYSRSYREPWLLVSSVSGRHATKQVIKIYQCRMRIEASFRDTKSTEFGLSLNENKTIKAVRYAVWLMLCALASLVAWIIGYAAESKGLHYAFQANTYRHRRVLSFFYLGCQMIRKKIHLSININKIRQTAWDNELENTLS